VAPAPYGVGATVMSGVGWCGKLYAFNYGTLTTDPPSNASS